MRDEMIVHRERGTIEKGTIAVDGMIGMIGGLTELIMMTEVGMVGLEAEVEVQSENVSGIEIGTVTEMSIEDSRPRHSFAWPITDHL